MTTARVASTTAHEHAGAEQNWPAWVRALALLATLSCAPSPVVRVSGGEAFEERRIDPSAYAAYARARHLESRGDSNGAAAEYKLVLAHDPESAEAIVRLAAVYCSNDAHQAALLFAKAEQLDEAYAQLWLERARCEMSQGHHRVAVEHAKRALSIDPTLVAGVSIMLAASTALNDSETGLIWLRAALAANPNNVRLWTELFEHARASKAEQLYAAAQLGRLTPREDSDIPARYRSSLLRRGTPRDPSSTQLELAFNEALEKGDVDAAQKLATQLGLNPQELAVRALLKGAYPVAAAQSELLLAVNPENNSAWVVGLVAAYELAQTARLSILLAHPPTQPLDPKDPLIDSLDSILRVRTVLDATASATRADKSLRPVTQ